MRNRKSEMIASECGRQSKHGRNDGAQDQRLYHCECDLGDCQHHAASGDGNKRRAEYAGTRMVGPNASVERHEVCGVLGYVALARRVFLWSPIAGFLRHIF